MKNPTSHRALPVAAQYVTFNTVNPDGSGHGGSVDPQTVLLLFDAENNKVTQFRVGEAVRACNAHAALVEALEKSQLAFMNIARLARFESKRSLEAVAQLRHCEERNAAALALAKEGQPQPIAPDLNHALNREIDRRDSKAPFAQ